LKSKKEIQIYIQ